MYKVLLVDDEPMALKAIEYAADWVSLGFSICGTCCNGKEAVDAIDRLQPDIVVTDIKMPVMDGLDLIRYAKENKKDNIIFILVSGYGEFEYARKAMKYGVRYYLQKPVFQEDICEIIQEIKQNLDKVNKSTVINKKVILQEVLSQLIRGIDAHQAVNYLKNLLDGDAFFMKWNCILIDCFNTSYGNTVEENDNKTITAAIDEVTVDNKYIFVLEQNLNRFVIVEGFKSDKLFDSNKESSALRIYDKLLSLHLQNFSIAVGECVSELSRVKDSYITANETLRYKFYRGLNCLVFYKDVKEKAFNFQFNDLFMSGKVIEAVEELEIDKVRSTIDEIFQYFEIHRIDPDIVIMFISNMVCKINNLIEANSRSEIKYNNTILEIKEQEKTILALKKIFENFCVQCCECLKEARRSNSENNIEKIEAFVRRNYKRNITIRELSENIYMHPAYVGQLFIHKFGICLNEYIHELRIQEAKKLMRETDLKNHEIAEELGYCNYNSFLKHFQKYAGMKPKEFRDNAS